MLSICTDRRARRARALAAVALATIAAAGCGWQRSRTTAAVDLSFAAGSVLKANRADNPAALRVEGDVGAVRWWRRGVGPMRRYMGIGALVGVSTPDFDRVDLGVDVLFAPPRADRYVGFQYRLGPRFAWSGEGVGVSFAAEWAHWFIGALFAEATYDVTASEGTFLVGARVNLLFPYILVTADSYPVD